MRESAFSARHQVIGFAARAVTFGSLVASGILAALSKVDENSLADVPALLLPAVRWLHQHTWWMVILLSLLAMVGQYLQTWIDRRWVWSIAQATIDRLADACFGDMPGPRHHNRVTLFKRYDWVFAVQPHRGRLWIWGKGRGPSSGWLVPVLRSGHTTQKSKTCFLAPDDAENAEGVAGQVWASTGDLSKTANRAPTLDDIGSCREYAKDTWVDASFVQAQLKRGRQLALWFRGIPIEVNGRRWGVLLLDSRNPAKTQKDEYDLSQAASFLGKLLERT